jgi:Ca2+-transporting ATPase
VRRSAPPDRLQDLPDPAAGLPSASVASRRARWGANEIVERQAPGWRAVLRDTARDPMIWFLVGTAALFGVVGDTTEAVVLLLAIVPLTGMDAFLHYRTQASTAGLASRLAARATVVRDGGLVQCPVVEVVAGDLAVVAAGEAFPADGVIVAGGDLQVDESALSGEAFPVRKRPLGPDLLAGRGGTGIDAEHWGLAGTRLLTGRASLRVIYTGGETVYGEIVRLAREEVRGRTPLQAAIAQLVNLLLCGAVAVCIALAGFACARASDRSTRW